jgi:hypothetical protein
VAEAPTQPFTGFRVAHPPWKFDIRAHQLEIDRCWSWSSLSNEKSKFVTSIRGEAIAKLDEVCVFGTNQRSNVFDLTINSDAGVAESWERMKRIDLLVDHNEGDPERRRIRDLQHEVFDKTPSTATLFYHQGHWGLECEIPSNVLEQLSKDLITCRVERLDLEIEWPFGLTEDPSGPWGVFEGGSLRGHVATPAWSLLTQEQNPPKDDNGHVQAVAGPKAKPLDAQ